MKKTFYLIGVFTLLALASCTNKDVITFRGIYVDDVNGDKGLLNPSRGLRLETAVDVIDNKENPTEQLAQLAQKYAADSISLAQSYFYLTYIVGKEISIENLETMQRYFDELHRLGMKSVLRFAYEKDFMNRAPVGPKLEEALSHLDQLKPFLEKNKDLIFVVQAGVIGAWGEWHSSVHGLENSIVAQQAILEKLLAVVPNDKHIQVRIPTYKNLLKEKAELYERLSFHDDFIVIKPERWDGDMHEGTSNFEQMVNESPYLVVDGELPWGFWSVGSDPDSQSQGWIIPGMEVARRLFLQHYSSLSVIHNYKEQHSNHIFDEQNAPEYSMIVWKKTLINEDSLLKYKLPVSADYFKTKDGKSVERNVFDYIRDHLGYRVELQKLYAPKSLSSNQSANLRIELQNKGFSTVHGNYSVYFVWINSDNEVIEIPTSANPFDWQPHQPGDSNYHTLTHIVESESLLPPTGKPGVYRLGLWIPDQSERLKYDARYAIRCANGDVEWWMSKDQRYGINILTSINVD